MRLASFGPIGLGLLFATAPTSAQVPRDLDDLRLEYSIFLDDGTDAIGTCDVAFENFESKRGPRVRVTQDAEYTLPLSAPWRWHETVEVVGSAEGVERFDATTTAGEVVKKHLGLRQADRYHVTTTVEGGETTQGEFPDDVRRSNLAMFCGAYLVEPLDRDELLREFPMLWPAHGTRYPRQKFRESIMRFQISNERQVRTIISTVRKHNKIPIVDRYYHIADDLMILLRLESDTDVGLLTWELTAINGVPLAESDLIR